ncbi:60S ribosomal protein L23, partial [Lemmus lemmus]
VKKGKPELRKPCVSSGNSTTKVRSKKRQEFLYFENNARLTVNNKGEKKGSTITGPVAKERADLWPRTAPNAGSTAGLSSVFVKDSLEGLCSKQMNKLCMGPQLQSGVWEPWATGCLGSWTSQSVSSTVCEQEDVCTAWHLKAKSQWVQRVREEPGKSRQYVTG